MLSEDRPEAAENSEPSVLPARGAVLPEDKPASFAAGAAWALFAVAIWSGWFVSTRVSVTTNLTAYDIVFLRYAVTMAVLLPFIVHIRAGFGRISSKNALMLFAGSGAPYGLCISAGIAFAPAAEGAALTPGVMPLTTAILSFLIIGEALRSRQIVGLGFTLCGVAAVAGADFFHAGHQAWLGHLLFIAAACLFSLYTIALRRSGLSGLEATAIVSVMSCVAYLPVYLLLLQPRLFDAPLSSLLVPAFYQSIAVNIVSLLAYGRAVALLGPARAATFAAGVPVLTVILGVVLLDEHPSLADCLGIVAVTIGVVLASGARLPLRLGNSPKKTHSIAS